MHNLPHMQRECFTAVRMEGRSASMVAIRYDILPGTVRTHVARAEAKLRQLDRLPAAVRLRLPLQRRGRGY